MVSCLVEKIEDKRWKMDESQSFDSACENPLPIDNISVVLHPSIPLPYFLFMVIIIKEFIIFTVTKPFSRFVFPVPCTL